MEEYEENQQSEATVLSTSITYGAITGLASIAFYIVIQLMGQAFNQTLSLFGTVILILGIILANRKFKEGNGGYMTFSQGLGIGMLISVISGIMSSAFSIVYITLIDPSFRDIAIDRAREQIETQYPDMSSAQVESALDVSRFIMQPSMLFAIGIISSVFFGFLISLIVSAILRKNPPVFFE